MAKKNPIIVTGAHRSGTTWVGQMIALDKNVRYIHEPFNIDEPRKHPLKYWFEYVSKDTPTEKQEEIYNFINEILDFNFKGVCKDFSMIRGPRDISRFIKDSFERINKTPLIKDPIALMSTDWLADKFDGDVVVLVRHPAAFVASLKVKKWDHNFEHYTKQEKLMNALAPYAEQIRSYEKTEQDIIDQGILLWNIAYYRISQFKKEYPDWIFIRHEDLSMNPVVEYKQIYEKLGLNFSSRVENKIVESSTAKKSGHLTRDSKENISTWKKRLTAEEIARIRKDTKEVSDIFYTEDYW